ncbi:SUMO-activating enzyme subunit 1 [Cichlidogyrus casuarinus]|uniref:SUMO-activating enzyme subunit 1 n=1 Tax=Cichlidogyrus casuarinus TaxID=1844966 RepID=A0ABD2Q1U1_9PLAT
MISKEEAALYDRQIRLWGLDAQAKIKNIDVILFGFQQTTCEIAKNLTLAGIKAIKIVDDSPFDADKSSQLFLVDKGDDQVEKVISELAVSRIQELNPLVSVEAYRENELPKLLKTVNLVICAKPINEWTNVYKSIRENTSANCSIIMVNSRGNQGCVFYDFNKLEFLKEDTHPLKEKNASIPTTKMSIQYKSLLEINFENMLNIAPIKRLPKAVLIFLVHKNLPIGSPDLENLQLSWASLCEQHKLDENLISKSQLENSTCSTYPAVAAILGGTIAQEVILAVSAKSQASGNWFFFDETCSGVQCWFPNTQPVLA